MRTNRVVPILFSVFCVLIFSGIAPPVPAKDARAGKNVPAKNAPAKDVPENISGGGTGFSAMLPDPKRPGKFLYDLRAASLNGNFVGGQINGTLNSVWARLYQNGSPAAVLTAPHAHGGSAAKSVTVTGTGGVVMKSLTEPGTKMTADTMIWYATENKIVATGHVFYHDGKTGLILTGSRMNADTRLKTIDMPRGGHGTGTF